MQQTSIAIIEKLQTAGFKAYWAGGCVRDMLLLGKLYPVLAGGLPRSHRALATEPKDFDIVTDATPEQVEKIFSKSVPIGKAFGVMLIIENGHHFQIATFRTEGAYKDGRRPEEVEFTHPEADAFRRDFTINGMFYDPVAQKLYDFVGGQADLKERLIRFIGDPEKRILEDHLRILRAVRFKNALDFQYHPDTYNAIIKHAAHAKKVSVERLRDELNIMIASPHASAAFRDLHETGILKAILPEVEAMKGVAQPSQYHLEGDVLEHAIEALDSLQKKVSAPVRWAVFLHDIGKTETFVLKERIRFDHHAERSGEIVKKLMERFHFSREECEHVSWLVRHHMMVVDLIKMPLGRQRHWFLHPWFKDLLVVFKADVAGTKPHNFDLYKKVEKLYKDTLKTFKKRPKPLLTGDEIMVLLKITGSPRIGEILAQLHEAHLGGIVKTKKDAKAWVKNHFNI